MRRDRITFAMMLGVPLIQLVLFGFAINNDPKRLPAALVTASHDQYSRAMISALELTGYYRFDHVTDSAAEAEALIQRGDVAFVVTDPVGLRRAGGARRPAADPGRGRRHRPGGGERRDLDARHRRLPGAAARHRRARRTAAEAAAGQLEVVVHRRYNPEGISQYNIVPGLLGVILQMTMVMMTSIALTRETERGTMESLLAMPSTADRGDAVEDPALLRRRARCRWRWCCWPRAGSSRCRSSAASGCSSPRSSSSCWRWCCSATRSRRFARTQMQAMQLTFFFFLPSILLSGFMFPFRGMPALGAGPRRALPAHPLPPGDPGGDAEGRRHGDDRAGDARPRRLRRRLRRGGAGPVPPDAGLTPRRIDLRGAANVECNGDVRS